MFINFNLLSKHNFSWVENEVLVLQAVKQKNYDLLEGCSRELLNDLYKRGFIELIKPTKKDTPKYLLIRLTAKAKTFLKDISIAEISDESKILAGRLVGLYEQHGLEIKNKRSIIEMISWYCAESGFDSDKIFSTVESYIFGNEKKYISNLNNLIWKGDSIFSTKWSLSQSKLYGLMTK